MTYITSIEKF